MVNGGRSSSVPAPGSGNPFWSERVRRDYQVAAARPDDLPIPSDTDLDAPPVMNSTMEPPQHDRPTGKGQGSVPVVETVEGQVSGCFETPPSKSATDVLEPRVKDMGGRREGRAHRTAGMMPPEKVHRSMGYLGDREDAKGKKQPETKMGDDTIDDDESGLRRALEREMVAHLREQNLRLQAELDDLKAARSGVDGSASGTTSASWETVGGPPNSKHVEGDGDQQVRERMRSPRSRSRPQEKQIRMTPNGTRVPNGPPPDDDDVTLPRFPTMPRSGDDTEWMMAEYEPVDSREPASRCDRPWKPSQAEVLSPRSAKAIWMEREVTNFRAMLVCT